MSRPQLDRKQIIKAIEKAGKKLGRAPSWEELRRFTGVPESRVRVYFKSLAEAVREAGLEPSRAGLKIATEELLEDFGRVMEKLGRRPSRNEYMRLGKFSAGAFYNQFGSWTRIEANAHHGDTHPVKPTSGFPGTPAETRRKSKGKSPQIGADERRLKTGLTTEATEEHGGLLVHSRPAILAPRLPLELEGKKRVTAAVCAMVVRTLLGAEAENWREALGEYFDRDIGTSIVKPSGLRLGGGHRIIEKGMPLVNLQACSGGVVDKKRAVMGEPFVPLAMTHAPVNELGTMVLFGMLAGLLGFEINAVWGKYPDCNVTQQVEPGKRQAQRVEVEFESRNFARHKHPARKCDVLICWIHNWKECPKRIQVIELKSVVERLLGRKIG